MLRKHILWSLKPKERLRQTITIKIHDQEIEKLKYTKFLGLYIDDDLSWKYHIDQVTTKIGQDRNYGKG